MPETSEALDFHEFHREQLPRRLDGGRSVDAANAVRRLGSLAFRRSEGGAYTYVPGDDGIEVVPGDDTADTVLELSQETWQGVVHELEAAAGLLYNQRAVCVRGNAIAWLSWEPGLRSMYNGRPIYDPDALRLEDLRGKPLDPARAFRPGDEREEMAHFLRTAGYLLVRNLFSPDEVERFLGEAEALRAEALKGDRLSWWGKNARGDEVLCRVTRAAAKPGLRTLPTDLRLEELKDLADEPLGHRARGTPEEAVSVIYKQPDMAEGLSDLPWHRDCGMGGHAVMCPILIASVFLTPGNPETGDLRMLPGSWKAACAPIDAAHPRAPTGISIDAGPGDVLLHYSDTMHAAPPPSRHDLDTYRISAVTGYARPGARHHQGATSYNAPLHRRTDGQIEHLSEVVKRP
ncbi:MAG: phytanoyl-CoA dioxygenase family protein [Myxococcota bacterium]